MGWAGAQSRTAGNSAVPIGIKQPGRAYPKPAKRLGAARAAMAVPAQAYASWWKFGDPSVEALRFQPGDFAFGQ